MNLKKSSKAGVRRHLKKQEETTLHIFFSPLLGSRSCALDPLCDLSLVGWYYYCHFTAKEDEALKG